MLTLAQALAPFAGTYSRSFLDAMRFVLAWETAFQKGHADDYNFVFTENVAGDSGGRTRYGVDQANHPKVDVPHLSLAGALEVYHAGDWDAVQGDAQPLPALALVAFDATVNQGAHLAGLWVQAAAGVPTDKRDGIIGPGTLACIRAHLAANPAGHGEDMLRAVQAARVARYRSLAHGKNAKFLPGWLNRTTALSHLLGIA